MGISTIICITAGTVIGITGGAVIGITAIMGGITTVTGTIAGIADPGEMSEHGAAGSTGRALFHNAEPINSFYKQPMLSGG